MEEIVKESGFALSEIEPTVTFVDGRTFLSIRNHTVADGLIVEQADLELVDTSVPVDDLVRSGRLQHQATRLLRLSVAYDISKLSEYLARFILSQEIVLDSISLHAEGNQLILEATVGDTTVLANLFCLSTDSTGLRIVIDNELWFGSTELRSLPREVFELTSSLLKPFEIPHLHFKMPTPCEIHFDWVQAICWSVFPAFGWKLPLYRDLSVVQCSVDSSAKLRIHAVSDLAPRRLQVREGLPDRQQAAVLKSLARQDAIKYVPASVYMLSEPDYLSACQQLRSSLPERASSVLVERMLVAALPEPSFQDECESLLARELAIRPNSVPMLLARAHLRWVMEDIRPAAQDYLEVANRLQRSRAAAHAYHRAAIVLAEVDPERSLNYLEYAISLAADHLGIQLDFAQAQAESGQHQQAVRMLEAIASKSDLKPNLRASALVQAGEWLAYELSDPNGAQRCFDQALDLEPEHPDALLGLAQILHLQGDVQRAVLILERLLQEALDDDDNARASTICLLLGDMWSQSDPEAALQRYQMSQELDPSNESARMRLNEIDSSDAESGVEDFDAIMLAVAAANPSSLSQSEPTTSSPEVVPGQVSENITAEALPKSERPTTVAELTHPESQGVDNFAQPQQSRCATLTKIIVAAISENETKEHIFDLLNEILQQGTDEEHELAYFAMQKACEQAEQYQLYSELLEHRIRQLSSPDRLPELVLEQAKWLETPLKKLPEAESAYQKVLEISPENEEARAGLASLLRQQDRFGDLLDVLGQTALVEVLDHLLQVESDRSDRVMDAGRALALSYPSDRRGQFYYDFATKVASVEHQCEAIFEASHYDDIKRSALMDFLASINVKNSNEDRATVLRTCLSLEENQDRRVELRMALGECLASLEKDSEPPLAIEDSEHKPSPSTTIDTFSESRDLVVIDTLSSLLSEGQVDHLESRAQRMLEEGKTAWAIGPMKIVQAVRGENRFPISNIPDLSLLVQPENLLSGIAADELNTPLGRLLFTCAKALSHVLPFQDAGARIEMDERGSEDGLREILVDLRESFSMEFRVLVDLDSSGDIVPLANHPPAIGLPANILKEASEAELRFHLARCLARIRLGGLLYLDELRRRNLPDWIELLYCAADDDALDRISYEYAGYLEPLRNHLDEQAFATLREIRTNWRYEDLVAEAATWPRIAQRVATRTGLLASRKLSVALRCLNAEEQFLTEDILDFLLGEHFARLLEPFYLD